MKFSYSRVSCYKTCPYQFKLKYIDKLETLPNTDANNALYLGSAMHTGIEKTVKDALAQYFSNYPMQTDLQINEAMKLKHLIPMVQKLIPAGECEVKVEDDEFIGFIDRLVPLKRKNHFAIYDYKYVSGEIGYEMVYRMDSVDNTNDYYERVPTRKLQQYLESAQLHVYKHFYEKTHPGHKIDKLFYVFIPKTMIRQKKTEDLYQFRKRLQSELDKMEIMVEEVEYDYQKVRDYLDAVEEIKAASEYPQNCTRLCDWCEYQKYCKKGQTHMFIPKIEKPVTKATMKKILWFYGKPCSGKTTLADQFPNPIMLNTDGNRIVDGKGDVISIKDDISRTGNAVKVTPAWEVFKGVIEWLETKPGNYRTVVVDLVEDTRRFCRKAMYKKLDIDHEHDAGFGKGYDMVETELLSTWMRLLNLDYEYIILISHEDSSKNITNTAGGQVTCISPNGLPEKLANTLWGRVTAVGRVINNGKRRYISFAVDGVTFGDAHVKLNKQEVPLSFDGVMEAFGIENTEAPAPAAPAEQVAAPAESAPAEKPVEGVVEASEAPAQTTTRRRVVK